MAVAAAAAAAVAAAVEVEVYVVISSWQYVNKGSQTYNRHTLNHNVDIIYGAKI